MAAPVTDPHWPVIHTGRYRYRNGGPVSLHVTLHQNGCTRC